MKKETAKIIKSITASQKAYREQLIKLVMELIDCALNRHNEPDGKIFLGQKVVLFEKKNRAGDLVSMSVNVAEHIYYNREPCDIQVFGEDSDFNDICLGDLYTMPIGMVEEVVKAIIETAKSE